MTWRIYRSGSGENGASGEAGIAEIRKSKDDHQ